MILNNQLKLQWQNFSFLHTYLFSQRLFRKIFFVENDVKMFKLHLKSFKFILC